jgi:hypothetical protein
MRTQTKYLMLTHEEAALLMDTFRVSHPLSQQLALKAAGLVLDWAAEARVAPPDRLRQDLDTGHVSGD